MSRVRGAALLGVEGFPIEVEVRVSSQLPRIDIVGLPEACVRESAARVRAAIASLGRRIPDGRITVNLAPAALRKSGSALDLPIAVGILAAAGTLEAAPLECLGMVGELALDGRLRPVRGVLSLALALRDAGCRQLIAPLDCASTAALAPAIEVLGAPDLASVLAHLSSEAELPVAEPAEPIVRDDRDALCLSEVRGQEAGKRALEVAAAGGHGLLLVGPPGAGKTMLARRLAGLLPPLSFEEALETTRIHSAAGLLDECEGVVVRRPFRAPHHSASAAGLLGGGNPPRPGEISLAHRGVLFLDELPEFGRRTLDALRQVLEDRAITLARARFSCRFPADFALVAAANPCPCGWYRSGQRDCRCDSGALARYRARISGPLLDRIDMRVWIPGLSWSELEKASPGTPSQRLRERVIAARARQRKRGGGANARIPDAALDEQVDATPEARQLLGHCAERWRLSARAVRRTLRVARSVADLAAARRVERAAMAEALSYRGPREDD